ncbi:Methyl-accepting chemotaxis sensory transducer [Candidatus Terasakiella magnetica]|uniref:Methyl-accepting chemotaxis sensory transducer n=1 Tax=Candidatus Terasakiella magnetica TaxID=1867952 RepID=A0A1C3RCT2_9PROT|nr:Cache 3/Cache 2 fusion domain-containing protein [Candidatus Terasakiella magnetica]SCA55080.1 Methyl-accepting chemotaxis sensory transducer [Candidatus Terasakiella magnetica]
MRITTKMVVFSTLLLLLSSLGIGTASILTLNSELKGSIQELQSKSLRTAAMGYQMLFPSLKFKVDENGNVTDLKTIRFPKFRNHFMIDRITQATGDTATIFQWDEKTKDFWRKTTNIKKPDGTRAINTPLGKNGRVYPVVKQGKTYRGEATIFGKEYYTEYNPIFNLSGEVVGILYVGIEKEKSAAFFNNIATSIIISSLLVLILFIIITIYLARKGVKPIKRLVAVTNQLADGNLEADVSSINREDEIGDMAKAIQVFKESAIERIRLEKREHAEQEKQIERQKAVAELTKNFETKIGDMLGVVSQSIGTLHNAADSLNGNAESTSVKVESASQDTQEAAQNVDSVSVASIQLSASIQQISSDVQQTTSLLSNSVEKADVANEKIGHLANASDRISEVVGLISDISNQTNLLALNATIEAARAGDAGKGFAVVASEVKNLASQTSNATEEIAAQIINIQGEINGAVSAIREISHMINQISEMSSSVAAAVEEQSSSTDEITRSVQQAADGTQRVADNIGNVSDAAKDTGVKAKEVSSSATQLMTVSSDLQSYVENFLNDVHKADKAA